MARPSILTESQKEEVRIRYANEKITYAALAAEYGVHQNTIIRICNPEYHQRTLAGNRKYFADHKKEAIESHESRYRNFHIAFYHGKDDELIAFLEKQKNVTDYVRQCILRDINAATTSDSLEKEQSLEPVPCGKE